jgi:hypothetical protein
MKTKATAKAILAGLLFSLLSASASMAAGAEGNVRMSRVEKAGAVASRATAARRIETFRSEKTDSWLCLHVSPFFCNGLFPTLPTTSDPPKAPAQPDRGRH